MIRHTKANAIQWHPDERALLRARGCFEGGRLAESYLYRISAHFVIHIIGQNKISFTAFAIAGVHSNLVSEPLRSKLIRDIRKKVGDDTLLCVRNLKTSWDVLSLVTVSCLLAQQLPHRIIFFCRNTSLRLITPWTSLALSMHRSQNSSQRKGITSPNMANRSADV